MRIGSRSVLVSVLLLAACSGAEPIAAPPEGPVAKTTRAEAAADGVPGDLVLAMAAVEGGLRLPAERVVRADDDVPVAGILEIRHAYFDSLARGAALTGVAEDDLRAHTDLGTVAGIRVLAELGARTSARAGDAASWADAVGRMSGYRDPLEVKDYVARVFRVYRGGGTFEARDGEVVTIAPHPEVPFSLTIALPLDHTLGTPEFPGATWFDTDCTNKCNTTRTQTIDSIVIHDTEGGWDASVSTLQFDSGKSVHYIVDADGSRVGQFVPESYDAWHAGNSCWNNRSVGIEHVGYASKTYDVALYQKSVELVKSIRSRHNIPLDRAHIVGHYQIPNPLTIGQCVPSCDTGLDSCETSNDYGGSNNHRDPGYNWQWCEYMEMLGGACACNDAWALWNCTTDGTEMWRCNYGTLEKKTCASGCTVEALGTPDQCNPAPDGGAGGSKGDASTDAAKDAAKDGASDGSSDAASADGAKGSGGSSGAAGAAGKAGASSGADAGDLGVPGQASEGDSGSCSAAPRGAGAGGSRWGAFVLAAVALAGLRRRRSAEDGARRLAG
jgi:MYXO-CTERM domain-containing protein